MEQNSQKPDLSTILNSVLSNPEALSSIMSAIGNVSAGNSQQVQTNDQSYTPPPDLSVPPSHEVSQALPAISRSADSFPSSSAHQSKKERELLLALKPFLSRRRCDTLDTFIRIYDVISLLGRIR